MDTETQGLRILAARDPFRHDGIKLLFAEARDGQWWHGQPVVMSQVVADAYVPTPTAVIRDSEAQRLMDMLWDCGIRPSAGQGSAGQLAATEKHLTDMQRIAFKLLNVGNE